MKKIITLVALLSSIYFYAQPPGGGGNGARPPQNQQRGEQAERKPFKASDVAGIFYYDINQVVKKLKIKRDHIETSVKTALENYNSKIKEIAFLNSDKLEGLDKVVNALRASNGSSSNSNSMGNRGNTNSDVRKNVRKIIRPIRENVNKEERILNESLQSILKEKQFKKWLKYQKKQKESIMPKRPNRDGNSRNGQQGSRQRREMMPRQ